MVMAWLRLFRPVNVVIGAGGVMVGAVAAHGLEPAWTGLAWTVLAGVLGIAGGNALNDAYDFLVDRHAHPERPVAQGVMTPRAARLAGGLLVLLAIGAAAATNLLAAALAGYMTVLLIVYESVLKRHGIWGNLVVSLLVGTLFVLGAVGSAMPTRTWEPEAVAAGLERQAMVRAATIGALAFLANTAREVFKDVADAEGDREHRQSLPHRVGARGAMAVARLFLLAAVAAAFVPVPLGVFGVPYLILVGPALAFFLFAAGLREPGRAAALVKVGMVLALLAFPIFAFLSVGLL